MARVAILSVTLQVRSDAVRQQRVCYYPRAVGGYEGVAGYSDTHCSGLATISYYPAWLKGSAAIIHCDPRWLSGAGSLLPSAMQH